MEQILQALIEITNIYHIVCYIEIFGNSMVFKFIWLEGYDLFCFQIHSIAHYICIALKLFLNEINFLKFQNLFSKFEHILLKLLKKKLKNVTFPKHFAFSLHNYKMLYLQLIVLQLLLSTIERNQWFEV